MRDQEVKLERLGLPFRQRQHRARCCAGGASPWSHPAGRRSSSSTGCRARARERSGSTFRDGRDAPRVPLIDLRAEPMERYDARYCGNDGSCLLLAERPRPSCDGNPQGLRSGGAHSHDGGNDDPGGLSQWTALFRRSRRYGLRSPHPYRRTRQVTLVPYENTTPQITLATRTAALGSSGAPGGRL